MMSHGKVFELCTVSTRTRRRSPELPEPPCAGREARDEKIDDLKQLRFR